MRRPTAFRASCPNNYSKGYLAMWMVASGTKDIGKIDHKALISDLHSKTFRAAEYPHLPESTAWDAKGDIDHSTFAVKIANGRQQAADPSPPRRTGTFSSRTS